MENRKENKHTYKKILAAGLLSIVLGVALFLVQPLGTSGAISALHGVGALLAAPASAPESATSHMAEQGGPESNGDSLPEVIEAMEKARVTTRILYVTAHPDDEPGALLAYLARGLHADVALLSLTRGEGGQNALGPEQAPQLGILRTEELSNATRVYGTRLFFTRAKDFGFTKTPDEAMKVWGDQVLEDLVRVIRTFRPHVIINSWGGVRSGHGHHQASGILTPKAYAMAADPKVFPEQLRDGLPVWKAESLLQLSRGDASGGFSVPVSEVSPLWGKSWGEIGVEGYLNHRTQGVGGVRSSPFFRRAIGLVKVDGAEPSAALLAAALGAMGRRFPDFDDAGFASLMKKVEEPLSAAAASARALDWKATTQSIARAAHELEATPFNLGPQNGPARELATQEMRDVMLRINNAIVAAAGIYVEATADRSDVVAGESFTVTVNWRKRSDAPVEIEGATVALPEGWSVTKEEKPQAGGVRFTVAIPKDAGKSLEPQMNTDEHRLVNSKDNAEAQRTQRSAEKDEERSLVRQGGLGMTKGAWIYPWPKALVKAKLKVKAGEHAFETETEAVATRVTSVSAETRPILLVPAVTLTLEPKQIVVVSTEGVKNMSAQQAAPRQSGGEPPHSKGEREIVVRVRHYATTAERIRAGIDVPKEWTVSPAQTVEFTGAGDQLVRFAVKPPTKMAAGKYELKAWAKRADGEDFWTSLEPLPTLPTRLWSEPSIAKVHVMDVSVPRDLRVGYVTAENDPIPEALREIGVHVELLDEQALAFGDLSQYDAIAIGIRAYELRSDLARANQRLLDYAAAGGTLVVQYQREGVWNQLKPAPYAATVGNGLRTTDENSPVRFVDAKDPLLSFPNVIRDTDFSGWVQERGLYYWDKFDAKYTPVLALRDPGEQEQLGTLVYARHGKGVYIYTGLSFFRQLPEGVPGAYRLFVNLLSQGRRRIE